LRNHGGVTRRTSRCEPHAPEPHGSEGPTSARDGANGAGGPSGVSDAPGLARREFLKAAGAAGVGAGILWVGAPGFPATAGAKVPEPAGTVGGGLPRDLPALGNGEPPALQFHAHPGGTGHLLEELWAGVDGPPFARPSIAVEPWTGPAPTNEEDIAFLPVARLAALLREGHLSPVELTELYLDRLRRHDPVLFCTVTYMEESALREAREAEAEIRAGRWRGPLHGIPWGLKDLFSARGGRTTWGAEEFRERIIDEDAEILRRLRAAGAILIAKLSTGRFARGDRWFGGQTRNPWNPAQGSSGSSAGSAAAVAAGLVGFGIGTETLGSIVSPARRCGVTALRPTFGRVSRHGGMVLAWSMDKVGPLCRSAVDCALVFHAIHGSDPKDPSTLTAPFRFERRQDLAGVRVGVTDDAPETLVRHLEGLGARMVAMPELPGGGSTALEVESAVAFDFHLGAAAAAGDQEGDSPDGNRFRSGRSVLALDHLQSQRERLRLMHRTAEAMQGLDLFVSGSGEVGLTNQTGHPAVVLPYEMGEGDRAQPVTATLVGATFRDDLLLAVADAYQRETDWHLRRPPLDRPSE
jgi:Asp-tRNA(Asn)/Glu-tRNA(Gln) amidotransferase A subunit family amidase